MKPGQKITVEIDPEGKTTIATSGFRGKECQDATKELEKALGVKTSDVPTSEARQVNSQGATQRLGH